MSQTLSVSPGKYILKQATENKDNVIKKSNVYYYKKNIIILILVKHKIYMLNFTLVNFTLINITVNSLNYVST